VEANKRELGDIRRSVRRQVRGVYQNFEHGEYVLTCPGCGKRIGTEAELHEWLVKRNRVPPDKQALIMDKHNCILVCRNCHDRLGQTKDFARVCLWQAATKLSASSIGNWRFDLQEKLPSLPDGLLMPRQVPTATALAWLKLGATIREVALPKCWEYNAAVGEAITAQKGRKGDPLPLGQISHQDLVSLLEEGRWMDYLLGLTARI